MSAELKDFVQAALAKGLGRDETAAALRQAGWGESDIKNALGAFAQVTFPIPVPVPRPYATAWDMFIHLLLFTAMMAVVTNGIDILFDAIDHFLEPVRKTGGMAAFLKGIRMDVSVLVVFVPLYAFAAYTIEKGLIANPTRRHSRPRKWVAHLALFATALVLCAVMIRVIYGALGGEISGLFLLKALVVLLAAGAIFGHFFRQMKRDDQFR